MSATSAACDVACGGRAVSSSHPPVIANGRISRSGSARCSACSTAARAASLVAQVVAGQGVEQLGLDQGEVGVDGGAAVEDGPQLAAGSGGVLLGEADHRGRVADLTRAGQPFVESGEEARACLVLPRRAWVAIVHAATREASACSPAMSSCTCPAAANSASASWCAPRAAGRIAEIRWMSS